MIKKYLYILFCLALVSVACSDDKTDVIIDGEPVSLSLNSSSPYATVSADGSTIDLEFRSFGGTATINVNTNGRDIEVTSSTADWFEYSESQNVITIYADKNNDRSADQAVLTVTARNDDRSATATINLSRLPVGATGMTINPSEVLLTAGGQNPAFVTVTTDNEQWEIETSSDWLLAEKNEEGKLVLSATPNRETKERSTTVSVIATAGDITEQEYVYVTQEASSAISLSNQTLTFYSEGGTKYVTVTTTSNEFEYEVVGGSGWLTVERNGDTFTVTVTEFSNEAGRNASIVVTAGRGDNLSTATIYINQIGDEDISKMMFDLDIPSDGFIAILPLAGEVNCEVDWGDGTVEQVYGQYPDHTYATAGQYTVAIDGTMTQLASTNGTVWMTQDQKNVFTAVRQWGRTGLTSMYYGLYNFYFLTEIPDDIAESFAEVTSFENTFQGCRRLQAIPAGLFRYASKATTFKECFYQTASHNVPIEYIPDGLMDYCTEAVNLSGMFRSLVNVMHVPPALFANCPKVTDMSYVLWQLNITNIPEGLFDNNTEVTTFLGAFAYCPVQVIPEDLFRYNTKATVFTSLFINCTELKVVPEGLFQYNTEATAMNQVFSGCTSLAEIPAGIFANNTKATSFAGTFQNCPLTRIPNGLFDNNPEVTTFNGCFNGCAQLTEIPDGLFDIHTKATNFGSCFNNCKGLLSIPEGLFNNNTEVTHFTYVFQNCTSITEVPERLFNSRKVSTAGTSANQGAWGMFNGCTSLRKIPADLFTTFEEVLQFNTVFQNCSSLESIPHTLFDNCKKVTNFNNAFNGCTSLQGESPYTLLGDGVTKVHIYQRGSHTDIFTAPTGFGNCFKGCTNLEDYGDIPSTWR